jgi:hypothetical protein
MSQYKGTWVQVGELRTFTSVDSHDGQNRIHMSVSCAGRLPTWDEMKEMREKFLPLNRDFCMFFPDVKDYVNNHPYCLHLIELKPSDRLANFIDRV